MYDNLIRLYDQVTQKLLADINYSTSEVREILMKDLAEAVIAMDKSETPDDVRTFLEVWYHKDDVLMSDEDDHADEQVELSEVEKMQNHAREHVQEGTGLSEIYSWLLNSAPKGFPPTIVYFGLCLYARRLYGSQLCLADALFGGELPEDPPHEHGEEDETEEDEDEAEEEDTGDAPK